MMDFNELRRNVDKLKDVQTPADIATNLGVPFEDVMEALDLCGKPNTPCTLICGKTGRTWHLRSFRMAYRTVCQKGLTDWTWHFTSDWKEWAEANACA